MSSIIERAAAMAAKYQIDVGDFPRPCRANRHTLNSLADVRFDRRYSKTPPFGRMSCRECRIEAQQGRSVVTGRTS